MISSSHTVFTGLTSIDWKLRQRKEMSNNNSYTKKKLKSIDKGFCLNYRKLSYRRKFIRTLWLALLSIIFIFIPEVYGISGTYFFVIVLVLCAIQTVYNYVKWQREKHD